MNIVSVAFDEENKMTDPFSTEALVEWLRKQPAEGLYDYGDPCECLLAQYIQTVVRAPICVSSRHWCVAESDEFITDNSLPAGWDDLSLGPPDTIENHFSWTFGQALARAEALLAKEKSQ